MDVVRRIMLIGLNGGIVRIESLVTIIARRMGLGLIDELPLCCLKKLRADIVRMLALVVCDIGFILFHEECAGVSLESLACFVERGDEGSAASGVLNEADA